MNTGFTRFDSFRVRILLMDADQAIQRHLRILFKAEGFDVFEASTAESGLEKLNRHQPDIVLLDLQLPDGNGINLIHDIHKLKRIPILILSSCNHPKNKIEALDSGAEDYIVKPFGTGELLARIRVALRRVRIINNTDVFRSGNLAVDLMRRTVKRNNTLVKLTPTEYGLLVFLISRADYPVTHLQLWESIRNDDEAFDAHTLRVHLSNLRHKLEDDPTNPQHIITEIGIGYRFRTEIDHVKL